MSETSPDDASAFRSRLSELRHDLRTPVGHIIGYAEMLDEDLEDAGSGVNELRTELREIRATGERLAELIDDLLGSAKTSVEELDLGRIRKSLREHLAEVVFSCDRVRELSSPAGQEDLLPDVDRIALAGETMLQLVEDRVGAEYFVRAAAAETSAAESTQVEEVEDDGRSLAVTSALGEGGRILIVDDDAGNRDLLERRLQRQGYSTIVVDGGEAALERAHMGEIDLILLDAVMPGLDGRTVLRQLKDDKTLRHIPVIMLSALDDMNEIVQCVLLGAEDYVLKPFNPVLLKARIAACLEKNRLRVQHAATFRVFISSPGDVIPERRVARLVINRLNEELTGQAYLAPIFWEDEPLLATDTFQAQIHSPRDTDFYIGIFWSRMGSPLPESIQRPDGTRYASGSEFEFEEAMAACRAGGRPEILVYLKTVERAVRLTSRDEVTEQIDQKERLDDFLRRWFEAEDGDSFIGAFHGFETEDQLEGLLYAHLGKLVTKRLEEDGTAPAH